MLNFFKLNNLKVERFGKMCENIANWERRQTFLNFFIHAAWKFDTNKDTNKIENVSSSRVL